ncbi:AraC family transcriptional regulator [Paenibacillus psychroresistens]|uniref:AraC family transcriptional regulator n=1 Tax=Paenibacillus psychroresistens TaxID=1778678 RepID=A0A6B8RDG3_9BACL|nr:AraC family transcriptional regulator [Paenibacillus psychroresistens]QGQ94180.1 AraC family transcriptional regulator [Paenibacillus psychroresistens]
MERLHAQHDWVDIETNEGLSLFPVNCVFRDSQLNQRHFHSHFGYELYFCMQGNGSFIAGDRLHTLERATLTIVRPMVLHHSKPDNRIPFHRFVLAVEESYLQRLFGDDEGEYEELNVNENANQFRSLAQWIAKTDQDSCHLQLNPLQMLKAKATLEQLAQEIMKKQSHFPMMVKSLMLQLFADLGRFHLESNKLRNESEGLKQLVERMLNYLITHYQETISLNRLCRQFSISRSYMYQIFKQYTGTTMNEFLVAYRINKAKDLLHNIADPITEIAISVGFNDISHFCHTFKRQTGVTPSQYRVKQASF